MPNKSVVQTNSGRALTALSVSGEPNDHLSLGHIFHSRSWTLFKAVGLPSALRIVHGRNIGVVICDRELPHANWMDLLERLVHLEDAPPLIVTSRLADERFWAEALNLGAYDVLAKPFDGEELTRTVNLAWLHWYHRRELTTGAPAKVLNAMRA